MSWAREKYLDKVNKLREIDPFYPIFEMGEGFSDSEYESASLQLSAIIKEIQKNKPTSAIHRLLSAVSFLEKNGGNLFHSNCNKWHYSKNGKFARGDSPTEAIENFRDSLS